MVSEKKFKMHKLDLCFSTDEANFFPLSISRFVLAFAFYQPKYNVFCFKSQSFSLLCVIVVINLDASPPFSVSCDVYGLLFSGITIVLHSSFSFPCLFSCLTHSLLLFLFCFLCLLKFDPQSQLLSLTMVKKTQKRDVFGCWFISNISLIKMPI